MRKLLFIFTLVCSTVSFSSASFAEGRVSEELKKRSEEIQANLPKKIDAFTTVVGVSFENNIFYHYIELDGLDIPNSDRHRLQAMQLTVNMLAVCLDDFLSKALKAGITVKYNYSLATSNIRFVNTITEKDCSPFQAKDAKILGDYYVMLQNRAMPIVLDEETNLIAMRRDDYTIEFKHQLHRMAKNELDVPFLADYIGKNVSPKFCDTPDFQVLSQRGFKYKISYIDMHNQPLYSAIITKEKCK